MLNPSGRNQSISFARAGNRNRFGLEQNGACESELLQSITAQCCRPGNLSESVIIFSKLFSMADLPDFIDPRFDFAFKLVFKNTRNLKGFLNAVLAEAGVRITDFQSCTVPPARRQRHLLIALARWTERSNSGVEPARWLRNVLKSA